MGNNRREVFLSQLKNYNIAHNKKLSQNSEIRKKWVLGIGLKKITSKFQAIISKNEGGVNFFVAKFCVFRKSRLKFARVV